MALPLMSVVIIVDQQRERGNRSLDSVLQQANIDDLEVILIDLAENAKPLKGSDHPAVRCVAIPGAVRSKTFGQVRAEAVEMARSPLVAILEEHSAAMPGWALATLKAFETLGETYVGVSGPPVNDFTRTPIIDAIKLMNASVPLPAHTHRDAKQLVQNNTSYRRKILVGYGDELAPLLNAESLLFAQLIQDGHKLAEVSDVKFIHLRESFLSGHGQGCFQTNRATARRAAKFQKWSALRTALTILAAPLLPWLRTAKLIRHLQQKDPTRLASTIRNIPIITAINYYCVLGQAMGLAFGEGKAGIYYLDYAVNVPRPEPDMERILQSLTTPQI